jgi:hypothetical protein
MFNKFTMFNIPKNSIYNLKYTIAKNSASSEPSLGRDLFAGRRSFFNIYEC